MMKGKRSIRMVFARLYDGKTKLAIAVVDTTMTIAAEMIPALTAA